MEEPPRKLEGLKINWTYLIICMDGVNLQGENINIIKKTIKLVRTLVKMDE
jgi:hypothetical protein